MRDDAEPGEASTRENDDLPDRRGPETARSRPSVAVGIVVLNCHEPDATIRCIRSLLEREPPSTCVRSDLSVYYSRRTRWIFIRRYFPGRLKWALLRWPYTLQRYVFRGRWSRLRLEGLALRDLLSGCEGASPRSLSRRPLS